MRNLTVSPAVFLQTFAVADIFWRDRSGNDTENILLGAKVISGTPIIITATLKTGDDLDDFILNRETANAYDVFDDGTGEQETNGILSALLSLTS